MLAYACTTLRTSSGQKRWPPSCRRRPQPGLTRGQTALLSCIRLMCSSTRMRSATSRTSAPGSTSSNIRADVFQPSDEWNIGEACCRRGGQRQWRWHACRSALPEIRQQGAEAIVGSPDNGSVTARLADRYHILDIGLVNGGGLTIYPKGPDKPPHRRYFNPAATLLLGAALGRYALKPCPNILAVLPGKSPNDKQRRGKDEERYHQRRCAAPALIVAAAGFS